MIQPIPPLHRLGSAVLLALFSGAALASPQPAEIAAPAPLPIAQAIPADSQHAIAMYGAPALPTGFSHFPYANPNAPKGGAIRFGESGGFDSLNPFSIRGRFPWMQTALTIETLMMRSADEPFTLYGLLAERLRTDPERSYVEFDLNPAARFSDGSPVTVEDVIWSFTALGTEGSPPNPRYSGSWMKVAKAEQTGPLSVRFTFNAPDREMPLILGLRPVLKKADWQGRDLSASSLRAPIGSGPYVVADFEPGRFVRFARNPNWWGKDLPVNRGRHNLDEVRFDYFGDASVVFEAFKAGLLNVYREPSATRWAEQYNFPAIAEGLVVKSEIPHHRPSGMEGLVMNSRRALLGDWRVREALILSYDFDFINRTLSGGVEPRITSYFSNSSLGMEPNTPAEGRELALLAPYRASLLPGTIEGYALPANLQSRAQMRKAAALLAEAGWHPDPQGILRDANGTAFTIEILLANGAASAISSSAIWRENLKRLGIEAVISTVDSAQLKERTDNYDFDLTWYQRQMSLSPGNETLLYWGAQAGAQAGSRNLMGVDHPAIEATITAMLSAKSQEDFQAAVKALDRILMAGRYVIPSSFSTVGRIAHAHDLKYPDTIPVYGDWPGFQPDVWWSEKADATAP